jgi:streptogramin lyase
MNLRLPGSVRPVRAASEKQTKRPAAIPVFLLSVITALALLPSLAQGALKGAVVDPKVSVLKASSLFGVVTIEEFALPTAYSSPYAIAVDKKDRILFTESTGNSIGVYDPASKVLKEYRIPSTKDLPAPGEKYDPSNKTIPEKTMNVYSVGSPGSLVIDKDGIVWTVLLMGNSIVRFDPDKEEFLEFLIPTANSQPQDIAADSKGRIWFVEKNGGKLGYLDPSSQKMVEMNLDPGAGPMGIAVDDKDDVWIGEVNGNYIGRYHMETKTLKKFTINVPSAQPGQMRFDKSGKLWFTQPHTKQLGVLFPGQGVFSVVNLVDFNAVPQGLTVSADNRIWVVDSVMGQIGYFDPATMKWGVFEIGGAHSQPMGVTTDSKGDIWFTEGGMANKIARLVRKTVPAAAGVTPKAGVEANLKKIADEEEHGKTSWLYKYGAAVVVILLVIGGAFVAFKFRSRKD